MNSAQFIDQSKCYLCGSEERSIEKELGTQEGELFLRWVRCSNCELVFLDPRPSQHALSALYDSNGYWQGKSGYQDYLAEGSWRRRQAKDRARWFVKKLRSHKLAPSLKVLEVGSAAGYFLQELLEYDVEAHGLDLSRPMVRLSERSGNSKLRVVHGFVEEAQFPPENFQGVAAWGCDSNFNDPKSAFKKFFDWLQPGGLLTFNFHDYDHWATSFKGRFKLTPNALYFLNRKHVKTLLENQGFELISMSTEFSWMNLASIHHHTGHIWLSPVIYSSMSRIPVKMPVAGSFRVLAKKR